MKFNDIRAGLVVPAAILLFVHAYWGPPRQERPYGRYTAAQILDRVAPLCRSVVPEADDLELSARQDLPDQARRHLWSLDGRDRLGRDILHLDWDADTGQAYIVSHWLAPASHDHMKLLSDQEAIEAAWGWLRALGIARNASYWRLARRPQRGECVCSIRWQAADRAAIIKVDEVSGALIEARSWSTTPVQELIRR